MKYRQEIFCLSNWWSDMFFVCHPPAVQRGGIPSYHPKSVEGYHSFK